MVQVHYMTHYYSPHDVLKYPNNHIDESSPGVIGDKSKAQLANTIYAVLVESHACEQSTRYVSVMMFNSFISVVLVLY